MPVSVTLKALGLNTSPNQLDVPPGSLLDASNVVINQDNIISQRRGFSIFGESFGSSNDRAKQLITYRDRILRHFSNQIEFDTGEETTDGVEIFDLFNGTYSEVQSGLRIKSIESNGNLYFTTSQGIKKISAKTADDLTTNSGFITQAGGIKAVDLVANPVYEFGDQTDFLPQDSAVAYRILWELKDKNDNTIPGTPSQRAEVYNSLLTLLLQDFSQVLGNLDNINQTGSLITDGNYVSTLNLPITSSASELRLKLIALAAKLDADLKFADEAAAGSYPLNTSAVNVTSNVVTITFSSGNPTSYFVVGSNLEITGFTDSAAGSLDGTYSLTAVTPTTISFNKTAPNGAGTVSGIATVVSNEFRTITQPTTPSTPTTNNELVDIQDYLSEIISALQNEPTAVISSGLASAYIDILDITTSASVHLKITVPPGITDDYFLQIYRSDVTQATGTTVLSDLTPNDEMKLVYEAFPTAAELSAKEVEVDDITPDIFRGANLYINEATGEGISQANDVPPLAKDINRFKNVNFYANTQTRQRKLLSLLGVVNMVTDYGSGLNSHTFTTVDIDISTDVITINSHGYSSGQAVQFSNATSTNLPGGLTQSLTYYILNPTTNTFQISATKFGAAVNITSVGTGTHTVKNQLPKLVISNGTTTNTYSFVVGSQEITRVTTLAGSTLAASGAASYFPIYSANDEREYYVWYKIGTATDPMITGKTGIAVIADAADTNNQIATKTAYTLAAYINDFSTTVSTNQVTITNVSSGPTTDASAGTSGFTISVLTPGVGEDASSKQILLSNLTSVGQAVDETARSLVRVINKNSSEIISAFYLSTAGGVPGQMFFEERTLSNSPFYILGNNLDTGVSFSPAIDPTNFIVKNTLANPTVITSSSAHGLINGDQVAIVGSSSTPSIDGLYTITYISSTTFSIPVNVSVAGVGGSLIKASIGVFSDNEKKPNRIYYSKVQQPEAVPLVNFFDVGSQDREILRIFPLRDSLFVFKEDGLFRVSGETAPFVTALFDSSCILLAPDSISVANNKVYGWTTQGISEISEEGVNVITRNIKNIVLKLASDNYTNFKTATWGLGYESDNSYIVYTVSETDDESAQVGYRYDQITETWTSIDKDYTCGVIHHQDDKMYVGAGDTNHIEKERKQFNRYDYADRELALELVTGQYFDKVMKFLTDISDVSEGDVLIQEQLLTIYQYNQTLNKLDIDSGVQDNDYYSTLHAVGGDGMRQKLIDLTEKLDADTGVTDTDYFDSIDTKTGTITSISISNPTVITTSAPHELKDGRIITITGSNSNPLVNDTYPITLISPTTFSIPVSVDMTAGTTGTFATIDTDFRDIQACYNSTIAKMNLDSGINYSNYQESSGTTVQESIVTGINKALKEVDVNLTLPYVQGPMILFKAIPTTLTYSAITFDDPLSLKHIREFTMIFADKAFTTAEVSFASDLLPEFKSVPVIGDGNGLFGYSGNGLGFGSGFFGGASHGAPFRTYIPGEKQYCVYINVKFSHHIAREIFQIYGITLTGETGLSSRAYR
jgi:hypothetical protein